MYAKAAQFKVVLTGEWGVGKSSLFRRFVDNTFIEPSSNGRQPTIGLDHFCKAFRIDDLDNRLVEVDLWDTAGLERFESLSASYFTQAKAVIVCYSDDVESSIQALSQHILEATQLAQTALVFLCGNKADLHPPSTSPASPASSPVSPAISPARSITPASRKSAPWRPDFTTNAAPAATSTVENLLTEYDDLIEQRFEVSCKTGRGVEEMFVAIATALLLKADQKHDRARVLLGQPSISEEYKHKTKGKCC